MNYYKKNLKILRQRNLPLYKHLITSLPVYPAVTEALADADNLLVKTAEGKCYLHSLYHREREWRHLFGSVPTDARVLILFGLGMGDVLSFVATHFPVLEHLVVIEPNLEAFKQFLTQRDLSVAMRGFGKISFIVNQTAAETTAMLTNLLDRELYSQPELIAPISYRTLYREYYHSVQQGLVASVRRTLVNLATKRSSTNQWLINAWRNIRQDNPGLEAVMSRIMPLPAILVSAGPSLNKNIHLLQEAKTKALIIAVGSAMTILDSHGITPHLRMAFDGNQENRLLFDHVDTAKCPLIYSDSLYHEILPLYSGEKLKMVLNTDYLTQYVRKQQQRQSILLSSGFSIANIAFDMVCKWGCPAVILVGQDLCYTDYAVHADGSWTDGIGLADSEQRISAQDIYGKDVLTNTGYLGMKNLFEDLIRGYRVHCINATEGGLQIAGSQNKTLRQVLDQDLQERGDITAALKLAIWQAKAGNQKKTENSYRMAVAVDGDLDVLEEICSARVTVLKAAQTLRQEQSASVALRELVLLAKDEEKLLKLDYYREVIQAYLGDILQAIRVNFEYRGSDPDRQVDALLKIYAGETAELQKMLRLSRKLLEEYKESQVDPALLAAYCQWLLV
ncbi:MAG: 6-hydroxymethylpterin diphosphokinase MptE-like protein [Sporomusaceae bacterium]|nr:6-hydroxymethylpterin diphosphokinase MptE-like protein [Sporomusaceae bacterium]